jgi:hypothetical protein
MVGYIAYKVQMTNAYKIVARKPEGKSKVISLRI